MYLLKLLKNGTLIYILEQIISVTIFINNTMYIQESRKGPITCTVVGEFKHGGIFVYWYTKYNIKSWLWAKFYLSTSNPNWIPLSDSVDYYTI